MRRKRAAASILLVMVLTGLAPSTSASATARTDIAMSDAIRIRAEIGLRSDPDYVGRSFVDPKTFPVLDFYGMPVSRAEAAELERRIAVQQSVAGARVWASAQTTWAGAYTDQLAGGVPVFKFVGDPERHRTELASRVPPGTTFRLESASRTIAELSDLKAEVVAAWPSIESDGVDVLAVGIDVISNRVSIGVVGLTDPTESQLLMRFPSGVLVSPEAPVELDACNSRIDCGSPIKGGLRITNPSGAWCTAGYIGELNNTTPATLRVVTAGHCIELGGGIGATWKHNGTAFGTATAETWATNADGDVGIITLVNNSYDDNLVYAFNNLDIRHFTSYALLGEVAPGDFFCRSGATTGYVCGRVVQLDQTLDVEGRLIDHQNRVDYDASPGDSGAPYMWLSKLYGIHSDSTDDDAPGTHYAWYTPYVWASIVVSNVDVCLNAVC